MSLIVFARKLSEIPPDKQLLLVEAAIWLAVARLALRFIPFPRIAGYLGDLRKPVEQPAEVAMGEDRLGLVRRIGWAVNTSGSHLPVSMVCLPRALAAWQMLHLREIESRLHFGAMRERNKDGNLETHAWLSSGGVEVTGYPEAFSCVELGFFAR